jgi:hypothetical protein
VPVRESTLSGVVVSVSVVVLAAAAALGGLVLDRAPAVLGAAPDAPPADAAAAPLRLPPDVPDPGGYSYLSTTPGGSPVRWDPCRPVHVVVRPDGEPVGGREAVQAALDEVGEAAGLVFVVDGTTDEAPSERRPAVDAARYGSRWSPVLVTWTDAQEYPPMAEAIGIAGPLPVEGDAGPRYVSGMVALDAAWFGDSLRHDVGRRQAAAVLRHELGHLVGLGHSTDPFSLMSPTYQSVFDFSLADRAGLASLGAGPCTQGS